MKFMAFAILVLVVAFVVWYAAYGRAWLKAKPWAAGFFAAIEPVEIALYKKSETILLARLKMAVGLLLTLITQLGGIDFTPILPYVPEAYRGFAQFGINLLPLILTGVGMLDERLRNETTKPLELVALPENKPLPPQVSIAVAEAEMAKETAVQVVKAKTDA